MPEEDVTVEEGVEVWISLLGLHMDPEYWPRPDQFDPERFSDEQEAARPAFTYMPFGEGPRACIGLRSGLVQVKTALAHALRDLRYSVHPDTQNPLELGTRGFFLVPKHQVLLIAQQV